MGGGSWSSVTYAAVTGDKIRSGSTFGYDTYSKKTGIYEAHADLDPKRLNAAGLNIREARDSLEHPLSKPMVIAFDQTGSMGSIPRRMQERLKTVFNLTLDKGIEDVQVAVGAYGDATNHERVPLQISQFESDNRIDDCLDNIFIEGMGGGNDGETSNLLFYYLAHHTALDSFEKRGEKGKLYVIADEKQVAINADHIKDFIGDAQPLGDITFAGIAADLTKTWDVTILLINNYSAKSQRSLEFYSELFGPDNVIVVQDADTIPETIAALFAFDMGRPIDSITADLATTAGKEVATRVGTTLEQRGSKAGTLR